MKRLKIRILSLGQRAKIHSVLFQANLLDSPGAVNLLEITRDSKDMKLSLKLKHASRDNISMVVIIGDNELNGGYYTVRDMRDSSQAAVSRDEILNKISEIILPLKKGVAFDNLVEMGLEKEAMLIG